MKHFSKVSQEPLTRYKRNPAVCSIVCNYILLLKISDLKYHCHGNLVNFFPFWIICSHFSVFSLWREISSRWPSYEANGNGDRRGLDWKSSNLRFHISRRWPLCIQQISIKKMETVTFRVKIVKKNCCKWNWKNLANHIVKLHNFFPCGCDRKVKENLCFRW